MRTTIVVCRSENGSVVTGDLYPKTRTNFSVGTEYTKPNATVNVATSHSCTTYEVLISPSTYGQMWVALEKNVVAGAACSIEGGCNYPHMALEERHFCAKCQKGPLHALCSLKLTGQDRIRVCSKLCLQSQCTRI